jgi:small-conductance mechanosensitive channel
MLTFNTLLADVTAILPGIVLALLLIILGWLVGAGVGSLVARVVAALRVDDALRSAKVNEVVERAGFRFSSGGFLGGLVKWFIIAVFFMVALDMLHLGPVTGFLSAIVFYYLPQVIVAVLILLIAALVADVAERLAVGAAKAADIGSPFLVGSVARWSIWIFAILAALDQLNVAETLVQTLFTGIVVAISLALGLSFGLGGRDAAARYIDRVAKELGHKRGM